MHHRAMLGLLVGLALLVGLVMTTAPAGAAVPPHAAGPGPASIAPARGSQWYHAVLGLAQAHRISQGAGTVVAVIDGGVDASQPKLWGQLLPGTGIGPGAARDGWRDDDPNGHGTAMAGIIAGRNDNGRPEVRGIAPAAKILPVSTGAEANSEEVAIGIRRAVDLGADVINLSLGSTGTATPDEEKAVGYALAHDVVVVASAGNVESGDTAINSPASIPGVVAVTGSTAAGGFWRESAHGPRAVIAAPAPGIRAPVPTRVSPDGLDTGGGTSNSAAIVAGVVALIRAAQPDLDAPNVIERLVYTARDAGSPGRDDEFGFGIVDPVAALTRAVPVVRSNPLLSAPTRWGVGGPAPAAGRIMPGGQARGSAGDATTHGAGATLTNTGPIGAAGPDSSKPSPLVWTAGLGIAASLGVLLGIVTHLLYAWQRATRAGPGRAGSRVRPRSPTG
ncbi:peptidase S8 [Frankia sp. CcI156]|uniref:S8 family serine peptidase n=1 Tax=unclassified Frankia TaxID=2632575 RepID=UPI0003D05DC5|nr:MULTISPECIES: S8 family serine peptidase [unclassified Frankia]ETA03833.1 hypothetical protein CcI6DRAFT_00669 [Frankia sp. CcI6]KDA44460.1 hypothetical protein BMG523Draft_00635 [Frankia sp. BMG5.23]OHV57372.1 peptidase S8 [Frankia sp. CgIS1]ONH27661.1 peptidase S8 [Frankia sp. CcI156]TFE33120.1 peptidase S8 [Frankia sp. B2]